MKCSIGGMRCISRVLDLLFPPRRTERLAREASPADVFSLLSPAIVPGVTEAIALMRYDAPLAHALIVEAKFFGSERAAAHLAGLLRDYLLEWAADRVPGETLILVPVPLSRARARSRGYNQVERICRAAVPGTALVLMTGLLSRTRDTIPQTALSGKERRKNMRGAFHAHALSPARTYIVVDDVTTTGATLLACADALRAAGAKDIILLALAS